VGTVALGVASITATFSVLDAVLLEPLPYPEPDRMVSLWSRFEAADDTRGRLSGPEIDMLERGARHIEAVGGVWARFASLTDGDDPEQVDRGLINGGFFRALGTEPFLGRLIEPGDDRLGSEPVLVLSHGLWQRRYGSDPSVVGGTIQYNGEPHTVVGVLRPDFRLRFPEAASLPEFDVYEPWRNGWAGLFPDWHMWNGVARLSRGSTVTEAREEIRALTARLREQHASYEENKLALDVVPLHDDVVAPFKASVITLFAAALLVALVAWANTAALVALRIESRRRDLVLSIALGATPVRIMGRVAAEVIALFALGSALGWYVAGGALRALPLLRPPGLDAVGSIALDGTTAVVTTAAVLVGVLLFGAFPVLRAVKTPFRSTAGTSRVSARSSGGRGFVMAETALAVVMMVGAGLLVRTYWNLSAVDLGFEAGEAMTVRASLPATRYPYRAPGPIADFYRQVEERVGALPGVSAVGLTELLPLGANASNPAPYAVRSAEGETEWGQLTAEARVITPGYLDAARFRLLAGRNFDGRDVLGAPLGVIVDQTLAERHWPKVDAIGQPIRVDLFLNGVSTPSWGEVIGVVAHVHNNSIVEAGRPQLYLAHGQSPRRSMTLVARTAGSSAGIAEAVRSEVQRLDGLLPVFGERPLADYIADAMAPTTLVLWLLAAFTTAGVMLALVGLFAAAAFHVRGRTWEIGVRMALGAKTASVLWLYTRRGWALGLWGVAIGLFVATFAVPALRTLVFGISVLDPWSFAAVGVVASGLTLLASYLPAREAASVDPVKAIQAGT
jgi:predicted permease